MVSAAVIAGPAANGTATPRLDLDGATTPPGRAVSVEDCKTLLTPEGGETTGKPAAQTIVDLRKGSDAEPLTARPSLSPEKAPKKYSVAIISENTILSDHKEPRASPSTALAEEAEQPFFLHEDHAKGLYSLGYLDVKMKSNPQWVKLYAKIARGCLLLYKSCSVPFPHTSAGRTTTSWLITCCTRRRSSWWTTGTLMFC